MIKEREYFHEDDYYYDVVRKNIKKYRLKKGLTQQNLADMTGMSREYICDIENNSRKKHPTVHVLGRISDALKISISDLFTENTI